MKRIKRYLTIELDVFLTEGSYFVIDFDSPSLVGESTKVLIEWSNNSKSKSLAV